jgi:hypothetical protein
LKNFVSNSKGSAIITAIGMGIVLMLIIMGLHSFSSHRIQTTIQTSRKAKALAIAEAGIEIAIAELSYSYNFATNKTNLSLEWLEEKTRPQVLKNNSDHNFSVDSSNQGLYSGKLGDGEFKVRIANIPYEDDTRTLNINEKFAYVLIESLGKYQDTIKRVRVVVNRRFPTREFLMYDADVLSLVYGEPPKPGVPMVTNVFSTGHLYGQKGVEISRILMTRHNPISPGTDQALDDMNAIISGEGHIFFFSPIKVKFRDKPNLPGPELVIPRNFTFPQHATYKQPQGEKFGEYPPEMLEAKPEFPEDIKAQVSPWVKQKDDGVLLELKADSYYKYRDAAKESGKGLYFAANYADNKFAKNYRVPNGWTGNSNKTVKSILLDFGNNIRPGNVTLPANFNGVIYAEDNIVIKGNPPKDLNIVTPNNVFVAGDFNQAGDKNQIDEFYGLPQDYDHGKNALTANNYKQDISQRLSDDVSAPFKNHVAAKVIAGKRVVYDYRSPIDCFGNELYPFMKYKLATYLAAENNAKTNTLDHNHSGQIVASATSREGIASGVAQFFSEYKMDGGDIEKEVQEDLMDLYDNQGGSFNFNDYDQVCRKIWSKYEEVYDPEKDGEISTTARSYDFGVYRLLNDLRSKLSSGDSAGDYLYFPEMTTNGMFISWGKRNNEFYAGPDYIKIFNEIGCSTLCTSSHVGLVHSEMEGMVHRVYGSEIYLRKNDVQRLSGGFYSPPTRRKIYDESLPNLGLDNTSKFEMASYRVLSWQDTIATDQEFDNF